MAHTGVLNSNSSLLARKVGMRNIRCCIFSVLILSSFCAQAFAYYHPDEGRWINRDPIGAEGGGNPYCFAGNNPLTSVDLVGLIEWRSEGKADCDPNYWTSSRSVLSSGVTSLSSAFGIVRCRSRWPFWRRLCDTETRVTVQARNPCCRLFFVLCEWSFESRFFGYDQVFTTIQSSSFNLSERLRGYEDRKGPGMGRWAIARGDWIGARAEVVEIAPQWVPLLKVIGAGGAWGNGMSRTTPSLWEHITGRCTAHDVGPCR